MVVLLEAKRTDSGYLKKVRELTYGNLGRHLQALERASYVELDKVFISRNPEGAFADHAVLCGGGVCN